MSVLRDAISKLQRVRRVQKAQLLLDTDVGQMALVKFMGHHMDDFLRVRIARWCVKALAEEGVAGVTVDVTYHPEKKLVELTAHAEDRR